MNDRFARFWDNQFVPLGTLLGLALIIVGVIAAGTALSIKNASNTLSVTGSATVAATADTASWTITATRSAAEGSTGGASAQVAADAKAIQAYLVKNGVDAGTITLGALHTDQDYSYSTDSNAPKHYVVREDVAVASSSPQLIQNLSQNIAGLAQQGISFTTQDPEYYVSTLPQIRISLMKDAVDDAKARAEQIVKSTGQGVGRLQSASSGVVQVLAPNSNDVSDYGSYDTTTIDKEISVTVHATFFVN
jgi:hypothetical protein